jgi:hypothetical protein
MWSFQPGCAFSFVLVTPDCFFYISSWLYFFSRPDKGPEKTQSGADKKNRPKDVFGRPLATEQEFEVLKNAPRYIELLVTDDLLSNHAT